MPFLYFDVNVDVAIPYRVYRIFSYSGIAVTKGIVVGYQRLLVFVILCLVEL